MIDTPEEVAEKLGLSGGRRVVPPWARYAAAAAAALALGLWWWAGATGGDGVRYVTQEAAIADLRVTVTATGTVEPTNLVEISSELSGTLASVRVDFNDIVTKGSVLATLDTAKLEAQLAVSKAALDMAIARVAMATATLEDAREKYDTTLALEERGISAHQTLVTQKAAFVRAQAELQSAQADRALAEANLDLHQAELDKACICSPIDGVVLSRSVDPGQIVAASLSAPVLFTVAEDLTRMELQVFIDEADIGRTKVGQAAEFTVDAYDERVFPARITEIRFAPETVDGVVSYRAILSIDNSDLSLRPGMTATADITVAELDGVLTVPNAALRYAPPAAPVETEDRSGLLGMLIPEREDRAATGDGRTLWVMRDGAPVEIAIRAGQTDGRRTAILDGPLAAGDAVVVDRVDD
ncbi:efflux RND transporter periplasmic adaptor subunit [Aestuariicoccus sp. MJ-SS9]|uniref:efflux RND transporter periplasmic adaptor subunit n=1 Tax=Aestuariicoccus sp. MJ-SS9 TaxID=3079855 RepID=UPI00291259FC|nr:efflux RND transporter periplasmic adaptor subunit [Aestuariicoccus sp. MJ-SS9]MDU8911629.1 efflux RND transporter periplasmic adaptor subunit [Aestuariicoccus sp. MJ-SS9]